MTVTSGPPSASAEAVLPSGPAIGAARAICPYLGAMDGAWRSAVPIRDQACTAVLPAVPLALEKQRRLCLTDVHLTCSTYIAAASAAPPARAGSPGVTRWGLVRTAPVVLDPGRAPSLLDIARRRSGPQLILGTVLALALAAIVLTRLPAGDQALAGARESTVPASAATSVTPRPTVRPTGTPPPSPSSAASPSPSPSPTPTAAPTPQRYRVVAGDTLYDLAIRFETTIRAIKRANDLTSDDIDVGQVLLIP